MFVVVRVRNIGLANSAQRTVPIDFGQNSDLESPISGDAVGPGEVTDHSEFTGERIPETVEEREERMCADQQLKTADQWRDKEARHPSVEPVGDTAVIAFAKFVAQVGVRDRVAESSKVLPVV